MSFVIIQFQWMHSVLLESIRFHRWTREWRENKIFRIENKEWSEESNVSFMERRVEWSFRIIVIDINIEDKGWESEGIDGSDWIEDIEKVVIEGVER